MWLSPLLRGRLSFQGSRGRSSRCWTVLHLGCSWMLWCPPCPQTDLPGHWEHVQGLCVLPHTLSSLVRLRRSLHLPCPFSGHSRQERTVSNSCWTSGRNETLFFLLYRAFLCVAASLLLSVFKAQIIRRKTYSLRFSM